MNAPPHALEKYTLNVTVHVGAVGGLQIKIFSHKIREHFNSLSLSLLLSHKKKQHFYLFFTRASPSVSSSVSSLYKSII